MPEVKPSEVESTASIKVIGVGGAGGSAVNRMREAGLNGVELIAMNTDAQALHNSKADVKVHLGMRLRMGLAPVLTRQSVSVLRMKAVKRLRTRWLVQIWPLLPLVLVAVLVLVLVIS